MSLVSKNAESASSRQRCCHLVPGKKSTLPPSKDAQMSENSAAAGTCGHPSSAAPDLQSYSVTPDTPRSPVSVSRQARVLGTGCPITRHAGQDVEQQLPPQQLCETAQDAAKNMQQGNVDGQGARGSQDLPDKQADEDMDSSEAATHQASGHKQTAGKGAASGVAAGVLSGENEAADIEAELPNAGKGPNTQEAMQMTSAAAGQHDGPSFLPGEQRSSNPAEPRASSPAHCRTREPTCEERVSHLDLRADETVTQQPSNSVLAMSQLEAPPGKQQPATSPALRLLEAGTFSPVGPTSPQASTGLVSNSISTAALYLPSIGAASKQQPAREVLPPLQELLPQQLPILRQPSLPPQNQDRQDPIAQLRNLQIGDASVPKPIQSESPRRPATQAPANRTHAALRSPAAVPGLPKRSPPAPTTRPITGLTLAASHQRATPASASPLIFPFSGRSNLPPPVFPGQLHCIILF